MKKITPYKDVNRVLDTFKKGMVDIFGKKLVGLYLTGSLAHGDFNLKRSDIDLVAILNKPATPDELKLVKQLHFQIEKQDKKWAKRIECSYLPLKMLKNILPPKTPRPYFGEGIFYPKADYGNEWLINNYLLYKYGIPLFGSSFKKLIKPVDITNVQKACIRDLFEEWEPKIKDPNYLNNSHYQSYVVLNLCRILYTLMRNSLASKKTSTAWVKKQYGRWKNLIQAAENWQYGKRMNKKEETIEFIKFVVDRVKRKRIERS